MAGSSPSSRIAVVVITFSAQGPAPPHPRKGYRDFEAGAYGSREFVVKGSCYPAKIYVFETHARARSIQERELTYLNQSLIDLYPPPRQVVPPRMDDALIDKLRKNVTVAETTGIRDSVYGVV